MAATPRRPHPRLAAVRSEKGAAAVEFALVITALLVVFFGILEFGRVYSEVQVLEGAAREGARVAAVRGTPAEVAEAVNRAASGVQVGGTPTTDRVCTEDTVGEFVTVSWERDFTVDLVFAPPVTVTREISGVFRCE